jgi:hypothetical protein
MPAQDGVGGEDSADLGQELAAKDFPFDCQGRVPASLIGGEESELKASEA